MEDKVDDLTKLASGLVEQMRAFEGRLEGSASHQAEVSREIGSFGKSLAVIEQQLKDLRSWKDGFGSVDQLKIDLALLRKELDELKRWQEEVKKQKDEWGRRLWALFSAIVVALIGWAIGYFSRPK